MTRLAEPHAGILVDRHVDMQGAAKLRDRAAGLPQLRLTARETADLDLVASGAASPLSGFMGVRDYRSVLERLRLADGTPWPIPFTLAVTIPQMASVLRHGAAALSDWRGRLRAVIEATDAFVRNPRDEALALYGTADPTHRGVAHLLSRPTGTLGGTIMVLPSFDGDVPEPVSPREVRSLAHRERWSRLMGVATLAGAGCLEPIGSARPALLPVLPVAVRLAPGRDAFLQALVLKNYGALDVFFEHDRADWLAASPDLLPEDLGVTPLWVVSTRQDRRPGAAAAFVAA
jgi:sulfate adenylyltransferase